MVAVAVAAQDIEAGEEINISYAALGMEFQQRQTQLQNTWGFKCTCAACTAPESSRAVSDQRRRDIRAKRQELVDSIDNADAPVAVRTLPGDPRSTRERASPLAVRRAV
ncbi:hypothetical protein MCOR12_007863 [Pyricularia oryzae]|nr:hypothetical protein MCOR12_007863 [Pyricularia oryzae]